MAPSTATTSEAALPTARAATSAPDARACPQPNHAIAKNPRMSAVRPLSLRDLACTATPFLAPTLLGSPADGLQGGPYNVGDDRRRVRIERGAGGIPHGRARLRRGGHRPSCR